jgi:DNA-binding NtrC family response regulator
MGRVLIVDDEQDVLAMLKRHLLLEGIETETETDPRRAVELVRADFHDVVITDIRMPGMTGVELLKTLKSVHPLCQIIMITAYPRMSYVVDCFGAGASDYFRKPIVNFGEFLDAVRDALAKADRWRGQRAQVTS